VKKIIRAGIYSI